MLVSDVPYVTYRWCMTHCLVLIVHISSPLVILLAHILARCLDPVALIIEHFTPIRSAVSIHIRSRLWEELHLIGFIGPVGV